MRYVIALTLLALTFSANGQDFYNKVLRRATFYAAANGGNSISDQSIYSLSSGSLATDVVETPFDYSLTLGIRKIARFGYENRANVFYDGTENTYGDAATVGKRNGFEFLAEADWRRQQGRNFLDQDYFVRYVDEWWLVKAEWLQDGFADIRYFESSQRLRARIGDKLSLNAGIVQRISEPYGYNPLSGLTIGDDQLHYTALALQEGYTIDVNTGEFFDPNGALVANDPAVWEQVVVPQMLNDYVSKKRSQLPDQWVHSLVVGYDFYHYSKDFWLHSWGNMMPYHVNTNGEYSYHNFVNSSQWVDYSLGIIFGVKFNKSFGIFLEGKYNKYWDREWHDFSVGLNYILI